MNERKTNQNNASEEMLNDAASVDAKNENTKEEMTDKRTPETFKIPLKELRATRKLSHARDAAEAINEVVLQGRIVHKFASDKTTILTINTGRATQTANNPKVVFFSAKEDAAKFSVGDFVLVTGNIQSSKPNPKIKNQSTLSVFGETITEAKTQLEEDFGVPGLYAPGINHFKLAGRVVSVEIPSWNCVRITVSAPKNGRASFVAVTYFTKEPAKVVAAHLPGSFIRVYGNVTTTKKEGAKETIHYQNYIALEIR